MHLDFTHLSFIQQKINLTGSKSESNRALILQKLFPNIALENISDAEDTKHLNHALESTAHHIDIGHAGTAMRFLTAYFAVLPDKTVTLTGSERMQNRPIQVLVEALQRLGADISYLGKVGYPPLKIHGKKLNNSKLTINAQVSSQYISALLLMAPALENGLELTLEGQITSKPYIEMTLSLLNQIGVYTSFEHQVIKVSKRENYRNKKFSIQIESDWSACSYYYAALALAAVGSQITLTTFTKNSLQGDRALTSLFEPFGVDTIFEGGHIILKKNRKHTDYPLKNNWDGSATPDIAQTLAVTCLGLGVGCSMTGLHTLKIKETDRLLALKTEMEKFGAKVIITEDSLILKPIASLKPNVSIATYEDHRMAMAFAPLCLKVPLSIENPEVVKKSYPHFWKDWQRLSK